MVNGTTEMERLLNRIAELEEAERYFRTLYEATIDAVLLIDPEIGIFDCNPATVRMFHAAHKGVICGLAPAALSSSRQEGDHASEELANQHINEALKNGSKSFEWQARRLDGEEFPVHITLSAIEVKGQAVVQCIVRDITELKHRELEARRIGLALEHANEELQHALEKMEHIASTDPLTSAWNRRSFNQLIVTEQARASRAGQPLTLILIDIDHFKAINDSYGHLVGDDVLVEVARTLQQSLRAGDYLFRWGGEEFAVLAPALNEEQGVMMAERLRQEIAQQSFPSAIRITISAGVAQLREEDPVSRWLSRADDALYVAKNSGRNRVAAGHISLN